MEWYEKIGDFFSRKFTQTKTFAVQHSPQIFFGLGIVGVGVGVGLCIKKSLEPDDAVVQVNEEIREIKAYADAHMSDAEGSVYTTDDYKNDMRTATVKAVGAYAFNYIWAFIAVVGGVVCFGKSNSIYKGREIVATTAAGIFATKYNKLANAVRERYGEGVLYELTNDITPASPTSDSSGDIPDKPPERPTLPMSETARFFDAQSVNWSKSADANLLYISLMEEQFNTKLMISATHFLSYNQVCGMLDLKKNLKEVKDPKTGKVLKGITEGDILGWEYDKNMTHKIVISVLNMDEYVKAYNPCTEALDDYCYNGDNVLYLDFNCTDILSDYYMMAA